MSLSGKQRASSRRRALAEASNKANSKLSTKSLAKQSDAASISSLPQHDLSIEQPHSRELPGPGGKRTSAGNKYTVQYSKSRQAQIAAAEAATVSLPKANIKRYIGPWQLGKTLGKGATGRVRKGRHALTSQEVAIKIVSAKPLASTRSPSVAAMDLVYAEATKKDQKKRLPFSVEREIIIMKMISHDNVIRLFDVWENRGEIYLVMELVEGGELFDYVVNHGRLPEMEAVRIFRQLISGLDHCHKFRLFHRDLKPENILLDGIGNVKIVDFGMASLQPLGIWLDTSCGSPHYAPPEIALGRRYDGEKADIWSSGIVLFVMLAGTTPFGSRCDLGDHTKASGNLRQILNEVIVGQINYPADFSTNAVDLISRILRGNPRKRIAILHMWAHPLLTQYNTYASHPDYAKYWIGGPEPNFTKEDCGDAFESVDELDMDIVQNLCALWGMSNADVMVNSLMAKDTNYERVFYYRLLKARADLEENYQGTGFRVSGSDYHHNVKRHAFKRTKTRASLLGAKPVAEKSHHSIRTAPEAVRSFETSGKKAKEPENNSSEPSRKTSARTTVNSETETDKSYDPFKPSRHRATDPDAKFAKITKLESAPSKGHLQVSSPAAFEQYAATARNGHHHTRSSSERSLRHGYVDSNGGFRPYMASIQPRSSSIQSSHGNANYRRNASYKRPVSFSRGHSMSHRASNASRACGPSPTAMLEKHAHDQDLSSSVGQTPVPRVCQSEFSSSPPIPEGYNLPGISKRARLPKDGPKRTSLVAREHARKCSLELEKFCEAAFNSDSVLEDTSNIAKSGGNPSEAGNKARASGAPTLANANKSLPELPIGEPLLSQQLQELTQTKLHLIQKSKLLPAGSLDGVLSHVDRLIEKTYRDAEDLEQKHRVASAPEPRAKGQHLTRNSRGHIASATPGQRYFSEPTHFANRTGHGLFSQQTIRLVPESSSPHPLPTAYGLSRHHSSRSYTPDDIQLPGSQSLVHSHAQSGYNGSSVYDASSNWVDCDDRSSLSIGCGKLETIEEVDIRENSDLTVQNKQGSRESKVKSWFHRTSSSGKSSEDENVPAPPAKDSMPNMWKSSMRERDPKNQLTPKVTEESAEDFPFRGSRHEKLNTRAKFFRLFGKRPLDDYSNDFTVTGLMNDDASIASSTSHEQCPMVMETPPAPTISKKGRKISFSTAQPKKTPYNLGPQNWFARFFGIKPAKQLVAFKCNKLRAFKEVRSTFKEWRTYGMTDIHSDSCAGKIWARVDAKNFLAIKPVCISVEFYGIYQRYTRESFCIAKLIQESGSKSSFERVVKTMTDVLTDHEIVQVNVEKQREMKACFERWEAGI